MRLNAVGRREQFQERDAMMTTTSGTLWILPSPVGSTRRRPARPVSAAFERPGNRGG